MVILISILASVITSATITIWHLRHINKMIKTIYIDSSALTLSLKKDIEDLGGNNE